ncbi:MAG: metal-sensing transcriptional repressor [Loigolactobacillus coryniformis]|uniref:metal-sensing transcriptional repressor n=1 Tax=Loigolactobacillus coryniformis TaxID=1610 RepID=UPI0026499DEF|nr:metal-sensing transcriptional repressor [Loigolactobacillus coryniformis]MDN5950930.1 metal-sensing transcriptional repressor [Loigolactobacillus coryniformis]MDN5952670.1 metal-sensing transcriptional repressor [Loigolactobacillus coryniformis]MDT3391336.1 metal-sensing transcriptional repressor [Bacillota bacterium]
MTTNDQLLNRLKRAEGQLRGIQNMLTEERAAKDVLIQLTAVRSTIDKTIGLILTANVAANLPAAAVTPELQAALDLIAKTK